MIARDRPYSGIQGLCLPCGFEFPLQAKGKEAAEDVAADGFVVAFMEDGRVSTMDFAVRKVSSTIQSILKLRAR